MLYTVCIYNEDDEDSIINYKNKVNAVKNFIEYLDETIGEELHSIEEDLEDPATAIVEYGKETVGMWQDYYYEMLPKYISAKSSLAEYLEDNTLHEVHTDFGYIFENEVE